METKQLGAKEKARRKNCDVRFSFAKRNRVFQNLVRVGARKLLVMGLVPSRVVRGRAVGSVPTERLVEVEEADGGSSRQERVGIVISCHGGEYFGC